MEAEPSVSFFFELRWVDLLLMLQAAGRTLLISAIAIVSGTVVGCVFGWLLAVGGKKIAIPLAAVLDIFRSVPSLILLVLFNSFFPIIGFPLDPFAAGTIVLAMIMSSYVAFIARAGIEAVPTVTRRAARSLGMTYWQDLTRIVIPIGLRAVFPSWIGISLSILKDSSLVAVLGYAELLYQSQKLIVRTQEPLLILLIAGTFYFLLSYPLSKWGEQIERRWQKT